MGTSSWSISRLGAKKHIMVWPLHAYSLKIYIGEGQCQSTAYCNPKQLGGGGGGSGTCNSYFPQEGHGNWHQCEFSFQGTELQGWGWGPNPDQDCGNGEKLQLASFSSAVVWIWIPNPWKQPPQTSMEGPTTSQMECAIWLLCCSAWWTLVSSSCLSYSLLWHPITIARASLEFIQRHYHYDCKCSFSVSWLYKENLDPRPSSDPSWVCWACGQTWWTVEIRWLVSRCSVFATCLVSPPGTNSGLIQGLSEAHCAQVVGPRELLVSPARVVCLL